MGKQDCGQLELRMLGRYPVLDYVLVSGAVILTEIVLTAF